MDVYLEIGSLETLMAFLQDAKNSGLLKDISLEQVKYCFAKKEFPIRIPVDINAILVLAGKPVVKMKYGKTIEKKTVDILNGMLSAT